MGYGGPYGYQEDASGLKLLGHRLYDSGAGRFLTRDPIKDGRNWYGYCDNDPLNAADPTGLGWHDPVQIHVDEDFEGTVIYYGDIKGEDGWVKGTLKGGQSSDPRIDVDMIQIIYKDGTSRWIFVMGDRLEVLPGDQEQDAWVGHDGKYWGASGERLDGGPHYWPIPTPWADWIKRSKPVPKNMPPQRWSPHPTWMPPWMWK